MRLLRAWSQQNQTLSPPPIDYLLGYGLLWVFAFFGARQAWRRKSDWDVLLLVWIVVTLPMLYAPFPLQRRLSLGLHVPIGILAAIGLTEIVRAKWPRRIVDRRDTVDIGLHRTGVVRRRGGARSAHLLDDA